jgi:hypothetical protein
MEKFKDHAVPAPYTAAISSSAADNASSDGTRKAAKLFHAVKSDVVPTPPNARSAREHLQLEVTVGCTARLSDIAVSLDMSTFKVGQALDALHLRDRRLPTPKAINQGLGRRWYNGNKFLVEWHISDCSKIVARYHASID